MSLTPRNCPKYFKIKKEEIAKTKPRIAYVTVPFAPSSFFGSPPEVNIFNPPERSITKLARPIKETATAKMFAKSCGMALRSTTPSTPFVTLAFADVGSCWN